MPHCAGAAMHVHLFVRQAQVMHCRHGHHRKGFVDLEQIYILEVPECVFSASF